MGWKLGRDFNVLFAAVVKKIRYYSTLEAFMHLRLSTRMRILIFILVACFNFRMAVYIKCTRGPDLHYWNHRFSRTVRRSLEQVKQSGRILALGR